jgi:TorA maturation chaperone TorD
MGSARDDLAASALARGSVYALLAGIFRAEPTADLIRAFREPQFTTALSELGMDLGEAFHDVSPDRLAEDLALEFTRLFIGPGPHVSPHESLHVELGNVSENAYWGPQTVAVKNFIEATGLDYDDAFDGMPDHIVAEFEFMRRLTAREAEAWSEGDEALARNIIEIEKRFFEEHLSQWIPRFCDKVKDRAERAFYREMAEITQTFMGFEHETLASSLPV